MEILLIILLAGLIIGAFAGYVIRKLVAKKSVESAEARAEKMLADAKAKQQDLLLQGKDRALKIIEDAKRDEEERRRESIAAQKRIEKREALFDQKLIEFQEKQQKLYDKVEQVEAVKGEIQKIREQEMTKLQGIAGLNKDEAKEELFHLVEKDAKDELASRIRKMDQATTEELEEKARNLLSPVIQRIASSHAAETTTTSVQLPSDEMKGRIIGKEGRNIKVIEQLTGTEIIVDETPQMITVSGFSPIRRQIAKRALDKLIADGRIHPGRIEEAIEESKKELAIEIRKAGEDALYQVGVAGVDPKLVSILGRLKFRTSYGQNILQHSIEVANLSAVLAEELGADVAIAKKGGLFHDIGKAVDHDVQGNHTDIGYNIMKKFGMPEEIAYACIGHHEDKPKTLEAVINKVADAISGARPGARKDTYEQYVKRLEELEKVAQSFPGVEKVYAIQAGREVRVFVRPQEIDDYAAYQMAKEIAKKIEAELNYPGEIKVTLIRETRVIEYAR